MFEEYVISIQREIEGFLTFVSAKTDSLSWGAFKRVGLECVIHSLVAKVIVPISHSAGCNVTLESSVSGSCYHGSRVPASKQ